MRASSLFHIYSITLLITTLIMTISNAHADTRIRTPQHAAWQQECSACHIAYPPQLLSAPSWRAIMNGLDQHFGTDARIDQQAHADILRFLEKNAGSGQLSTSAQPPLRITETRWFIHEHSEELPADIWTRPGIKSPANCMACHSGADRGDYSEAGLRLPQNLTIEDD